MAAIDVIIPTCEPGDRLEDLLKRLLKQSCPVSRVIIMNTESRYWNAERYEPLFEGSRTRLSVTHLTRDEFDHGATRHEAIAASDADICVCMTQDCIPYDRNLIRNLKEALMQAEDVAVAYARQLPAAGCGPIERRARQFNYPQESCVKGGDDLERLGIKTYFCSNSCAAYKREIYLKLGGFTRKTIFNEDMVFAAGAVKAGYRIAYAAQAKVIHSHNDPPLELLRRNFDLAVSQADHPEVFADLSSEGEGMRLVKDTALWLVRTGRLLRLPELFIKSGCKYAGFLLGKRYKRLPKAVIRFLTKNQSYWRRQG